ncbi:SRPBCC family protein [Chloroflexota bacterium]
MAFMKKMTTQDSVEIETTPEKVWEFWTDMDKNYKTWHPQDHILFRWTKGKPMEEGSTIYAEEVVGGKLIKGKVTCVEVVPYRKFSLKVPFPKSLFVKYEYTIEPRESKTVFTALTHLKYPFFSEKHIQRVIEIGEKHVREEGENMKKILEGGNT